MNYQNDIAALALRIALGVMFLTHGLTKLLVFTPAGTVGFFASLGLPSFVAYLTILFEIGGGLFLLVGLLSRLIAAIAVVQLVVITFIHLPNGWSFGNPGGGWEYPAFMALTAFALCFIGDGRIALMGKVMRIIKK